MRRMAMKFQGATLHAVLADTPTAEAVWQALPFEARAMTWGDEVYFFTPARAEVEADARCLIDPGEIAFWPEGDAIAVGFGETPISAPGEIRLASDCNVFAQAEEDVTALKVVATGSPVRCEKA